MNEYINFKNLKFDMDNAVDYMFRAIDNNNIDDFKMWFKIWNGLKSDILKNKYNECGHTLCDEILQYAKKNNLIDDMIIMKQYDGYID